MPSTKNTTEGEGSAINEFVTGNEKTMHDDNEKYMRSEISRMSSESVKSARHHDHVKNVDKHIKHQHPSQQ